MLKKLWMDEQGATITEYIILLALIGLAAFAIIKGFGREIVSFFNAAIKKVKEATGSIT